MNAYLMLFLEVIMSVVVSTAVLYVLSCPLVRVLERICPDEQAALFWLSYTKVMLMIVPLLLVLIVDLFTQLGAPIESLRITLIAILGGLLLGLYSVGNRLGKFVTIPEQMGKGL